jgi:hypothetical protein
MLRNVPLGSFLEIGMRRKQASTAVNWRKLVSTDSWSSVGANDDWIAVAKRWPLKWQARAGGGAGFVL